jgi:hypothetical protein
MGWDQPLCKRGELTEPTHAKSPTHIDVPLAYDGMDTSELRTLTYGGVDFIRLDPDEAWEMHDGRITAIELHGVRYERCKAVGGA